MREALHPLWLATSSLERVLAPEVSRLAGCVLDLGAAEAPYRRWAASGVRWISLDYPETSARRRTAAAPDLWGDAGAVPLLDGSVDAVLCTEVLEHVPQPPAVMAEVVRVLRPGGRLVLTAPFIWGLHEAPRDYHRFTRYGLEALASSAGLVVERIVPTTSVWETYAQRLSSLFWHRFGAGRPWGGLVRPVCALLQLGGRLAARILPGGEEPLDYLLVASRPL